MASAESDHLASVFGGIKAAFQANPDLPLPLVREVLEGLSRESKEPDGVTYADVDAGGVPALWAIPNNADDKSALIFFHAGGTVVFSKHSDRKAAGHLAKAAGVRVLVVDFRRSPEDKFPAQHEDSDAAYDWLLSQGYRAENIIPIGHSVGGNFAVSLALRLRDKGKPLPPAIVSLSAWYDTELKSKTIETHAERDTMLSRQLAELFRECWLGGTGVAFDDPRVNLLNADLKGLPPINVHYGSEEILVGEIQDFVSRAKAANVEISATEIPSGQHLFLLGAGRVPETDKAIAEIGKWIRSKLGLK
jgi:epsilon-lactone hydrolase